MGRSRRVDADGATATAGGAERVFRYGRKVGHGRQAARRAHAAPSERRRPAAPAVVRRSALAAATRFATASPPTPCSPTPRSRRSRSHSRPRSPSLARVKGVGPAKLEQYGDAVLDVVNTAARGVARAADDADAARRRLRRRRARTSARTRTRPRRRAGHDPIPCRRAPTSGTSSTSSTSESPGDDLAAEASAVEPAEQRQLAGVARIGEHRDRPDLGDRLAHQHAGQRRPAREVAAEEPLVAGQRPPTARHARRARG